MLDEDVSMFLKACLDASEERQGDAYKEGEAHASLRLGSNS